jgi:two-component system probable response regulator PhcQ
MPISEVTSLQEKNNRIQAIHKKEGDKNMEKKTLLIVDDEANIIKSITRALMDDCYRIVTAMSGEEGLAKLRKHEVDLVISDQKMPGMSGLEFLKKVRVNYPNILCIILTAYGDMDTVLAAINEVGVYKFILKPWDQMDLRITIKRALESRDLTRERDSLLGKVRTQEILLEELEKKYPGITRVERDRHGKAILEL